MWTTFIKLITSSVLYFNEEYCLSSEEIVILIRPRHGEDLCVRWCSKLARHPGRKAGHIHNFLSNMLPVESDPPFKMSRILITSPPCHNVYRQEFIVDIHTSLFVLFLKRLKSCAIHVQTFPERQFENFVWSDFITTSSLDDPTRL